ncbi:uncharacterized protein LOC121837804 [Ixodes scapularis]|uniref:uncharacterized protein LOC121837804 n=1 Tax=Ixodes scapularis TaxID=6945 RepID=UPI001C386A78|nr:uncharacterized protein LOC121837804 [Ixodes scapularis]
MDRLKQKRKALRSQVTKLLTEIDTATQTEVPIEEELNVLLTRLNALHGQLTETDSALEPLLAASDIEQEYARTVEYSDRIVTYSARLTFKARTLHERASTSGQEITTNHRSPTLSVKVKLPELELLKFNGQRQQWQPFWEQFEQVIHGNPELSSAEKFHYLRSALSGEAAAAIAGLPPTASCYEDAREIINSRYGDEALLVDDHMMKLAERQPVRTSEDVRGLRRLHDDLQAHIRGLKSLGVNEDSYSTLLCPLVLRLIPEGLVLTFNRNVVRKKEQRRPEDEAVNAAGEGNQHVVEQSQLRQLPSLMQFLRIEVERPRHFYRNDKQSCVFCKSADHETELCTTTIGLPEKRKILTSSGRCFRCTKKNHLAKQCRKNISCSNCQGRHASVMCDPTFLSSSRDDKGRQEKKLTSAGPVALQSTIKDGVNKTVLLQTATVWSLGLKQRILVRVLFDGGSQRSFFTEVLSRKLRCKHLGNERLTVGAFGDHTTEQNFRRVLVTLENQRGEVFRLEALETSRICGQRLPYPREELRPQLKKMGYTAADFCEAEGPNGVDILIGGDCYWNFVTGQVRRLDGKLRAIETSLGWTVHGPTELSASVMKSSQMVVLNAMTNNMDASEIMQRLWKLESIGITDEPHSETEPVIASYKETVKKIGLRYEVALPWKPVVNLDDNKQVAGVFKVLGLTWNPATDLLTFAPDDVLNFVEKHSDTKRFVLQTTARLYDPLGFFAPFVVRAKILFQQIWKQKMEWDDLLPLDLRSEWHRWCADLPLLCDVMVPRFYRRGIEGVTIRTNLHIFADASPQAYGAVAYVTMTNDPGSTTSTILLCKS